MGSGIFAYTSTMKTQHNSIALVFIFGLLTACAGISVSQDYLQTADFFSLKSYRWSDDVLQKEKETQSNNPLMNSRIHNAVDRKLAIMGYRLSDDLSADFIVSYQTEVHRRLTSNGASTSISVGFGNFGNFGAIGVGTGDTLRDEDEITMDIDILSSKDSSLLWRGTSTRVSQTHVDPGELTRIIDAHVAAILNQFPPKKKSATN